MGMDAPWSLDSEALATIADLLYALLRVTVAANSKRGARGMPSFSFPRPHRIGDKPPPPSPGSRPSDGSVRGFGAFEHRWGDGNG